MNKTKIFIFSIIFIIVTVYFNWFSFQGIITDGDFYYINKDALITLRAEYFSTWLSDSSFGRALIDLSQAPTYALFGLLAKYLGLGFQYSERIVFFIPLLLFSVLGSYLFFSSIFKGDTWAISVSMSIYLLNTYALTNQTGHITLALAYSLLPLCLYFLHKGYEFRDNKSIVISGLFLCLLGYYETRLLFVVGFILLIYGIYFGFYYKKFFLKQTIILFGIIISLNLFWIIPFKFLGFSDGSILSRGLFGAPYWDILHAFTLHQPWWNFYTGIEVFQESPVGIPLLILPVTLIYGLIILRGYKGNLLKIFIPIAITGIFLSKMTAGPFSGVYPWLYENFPFFNAFREPTKFYILIAISYAVIIGLFISKINGKKRIVFGGLILLVGFYNLSIHTTFNRQFLDITEPIDGYNQLTEILENDKDFGRILWVPRYDRWGYYSKNHSIINTTSEFSNIKSEDFFPIRSGYDFFRNIDTLLTSNYSEELLKKWQVKYVVLPLYDINVFHYGLREDKSIKDKYYQLLSSLQFLEEISNSEDKVKIFLLKESIPSRIKFNEKNINQKSETQHSYNISLTGIDSGNLTFYETFHPGWKLYIGGYVGLNKPELLDKKHEEIYNYANNWFIESSEIISHINNNYSIELEKEGYPKVLQDGSIDYKYYIQNADGSIDLELTLYFKPQLYFYIGLIISGATFALLILWLIINSMYTRNRRRHV